MKIQIESLNTFIAAADTGSFSAAARKLSKSQAAISLSIQNLEIDLGFALFYRNRKLPELTQQGELILKDARDLMSQYRAFIERSISISNVEQVKLCIGIDPLVCCHKINEIIQDFSTAFPLIELKIVQRSSESLNQKLNDKKIDFALGIFKHDIKSNFEYLSAFKLHGYWVVAPNYAKELKLFSDNGVVKADKSLFSRARILLPSETPSIYINETNISKQVWYVEDIHTLLSFCRNGLGFAYLPSFVVEHDLKNGKLDKLLLESDLRSENYLMASLIYPAGISKSIAMEWLSQRFLDFKVCR
ncbi:LysR family transcriptional regulator [Shewanella marinintestina]|uniref:LysR family transcriptional regulator n=1 Tax=Shewanella marinintestina TaxID=190305 RepID=UPI00200C92FC|nr:LysR family transcriptional regulator [Shewanella marinintestina]MCL1145373.1 LysR family transcriptional regulator [Shewanella marinintestina]